VQEYCAAELRERTREAQAAEQAAAGRDGGSEERASAPEVLTG
jgi:hypothetical protein